MRENLIRKKLILYIDATIPNYVFNDHVPEKQSAARTLFGEVKEGKSSILISPVLLEELNASPEPKRTTMLNLLKNFPILEQTREIEILANDYITEGIIPQKNLNDARHIAFATFYRVDALVSYNFEHIVRIETIDKVTAINLLRGYNTPKIVIPEEVIENVEGV